MELGGELHHCYGSVVSEPLSGLGKRSTEWNLNDWRWDGDFLRAAPLNAVPSDCRSRQFFPNCTDLHLKDGFVNFLSPLTQEPILGNGMEKKEFEKKRGYVEINKEEEHGSLNLKLGGQVFPAIDGDTDKWEKTGKKSKLSSVQFSRAVCQVEDCKTDLSSAKDYHRRHKVCEVHSKASRALVGNIMQRFCQQCSRFHALEEFDEGKRSCRRRLAGHNKRRRKANPENLAGSSSLSDEQGAKYLLTSLLRILSNTQSSSSKQTNDQDLLSHLLRNLATVAGSTITTSPSRLLPVSQNSHNAGIENKDTSPNGKGLTLTRKSALTDIVRVEPVCETSPPCSSNAEDQVGRIKMSNIDLNNVYDDTEDCTEDFLDNVPCDNPENVSPCLSPWSFKASQRSSPLQDSGNSVSSHRHSPSTSSRESQTHTDRIVFKLFSKSPDDLPLDLRKQILDWLSNSPTDLESYIRPGCIILTIYACMNRSNWNELYCNLSSSLSKLLDASYDPFWKTDWIYARVQHRASFAYNGQFLLDMPISSNAHQSCRISIITPIAISFSESVHFIVKGYNLSSSNSRLHCALEGKYLIQENCTDIVGDDSLCNQEEIQCLGFSCTIPDLVGRGFIEVEDHCLNSSFFPFIVAEKDVCAEIRSLETIIEVTENASDTTKIEARNQALNFVHEMGWLLHKSHLVFRLGETNEDLDLFPFWRYKYLIEFAIDHEWPAVVRKLLNVLFDGAVVAEGNKSISTVLFDSGLLHRAVRKHSLQMVKFLLTYQPSEISMKTGDAHEQTFSFLFKPDANGPGGVTPLHIAASLDDSDAIIDSLTNDPESVGIEAWKNARDSTGSTPNDYARLRGHYSYIHLVQKKLNKKHGQVVVDIPDSKEKQRIEYFSTMGTLETEKKSRGNQLPLMNCKRCRDNVAYGSPVAFYRPAMVSMIAIAAVCMCVALLFKSSPEVVFSFRPFRWEQLKYGAQ